VKRVRIGYMKIKGIKGLMKIELIPISREETLAILKGEKAAGESKALHESKKSSDKELIVKALVNTGFVGYSSEYSYNL